TPEPDDASDVALDYRERAPAAITPTTVADLPETASITSGLAVSVPGSFAGLLRALVLLGSLPLADIVAPAVEAARACATLPAPPPVRALSAPSVHARSAPGAPARSARPRVPTAEPAEPPAPIAAAGRAASRAGEAARAVGDTMQAGCGVTPPQDPAAYRAVG